MNTRALDSLLDRSRDFSVASVLASYPDEEVAATLTALAPALVDHAGAGPLVRALTRHGGAEDLRSTYIDRFDRGERRVSLHETEHGRMRGMAKGNDLADISGFYRAFGLVIDDEAAHEMLDHLAVELEFYAVLLAKQDHLLAAGDAEGTAVVEDARRKFLEAHLGPLALAAARHACPPGTTPDEYGAALAWCGELTARECEVLGATPTPLDFFATGEDASEMKCGAVHLPVLP